MFVALPLNGFMDENIYDEALLEARSESNPGARLLDAACELFYERGYHATGINEMIALSGTSKKSFYNYFPGKRELGAAYLAREVRSMQGFLEKLARKHGNDHRRFFRTWGSTLKKRASCGDFHGCPFAAMAAQEPTLFADALQEAMALLRERLERYLRDCDLALSRATASRLAALITVQYEGAIQMWKLTGDRRYFDLFAHHCETVCQDAKVGMRA